MFLENDKSLPSFAPPPLSIKTFSPFLLRRPLQIDEGERELLAVASHSFLVRNTASLSLVLFSLSPFSNLYLFLPSASVRCDREGKRKEGEETAPRLIMPQKRQGAPRSSAAADPRRSRIIGGFLRIEGGKRRRVGERESSEMPRGPRDRNIGENGFFSSAIGVETEARQRLHKSWSSLPPFLPLHISSGRRDRRRGKVASLILGFL